MGFSFSAVPISARASLLRPCWARTTPKRCGALASCRGGLHQLEIKPFGIPQFAGLVERERLTQKAFRVHGLF